MELLLLPVHPSRNPIKINKINNQQNQQNQNQDINLHSRNQSHPISSSNLSNQLFNNLSSSLSSHHHQNLNQSNLNSSQTGSSSNLQLQQSSSYHHSFEPSSFSTHHHDSNLDELTDEQKAQIIRRHLMNKEEQQAARRILNQSKTDTSPSGNGSSSQSIKNLAQDHLVSTTVNQSNSKDHESYPTPFHLPGGDIHHAVYKWANKQSNVNSPNAHLITDPKPNQLGLFRTRSISVSGTSFRDSEIGIRDTELGTSPNNLNNSHQNTGQPIPTLAYKDIMQPGGFRRAFLYQKRAAIGKPIQESDDKRFTKNFIDFLSLYGHFGGEDLEEIDEVEEAAFSALHQIDPIEDGISDDDLHSNSRRDNERTALLAHRRSRPELRSRQTNENKRNRSLSFSRKYPGFHDGSNGDATVTQAILMLLKSLVGTGVLFLAKAFSNGGMLFSIVMLSIISIISLYSFILLVETRLEIPGGFGEIGGLLYGPWCRRAILFSLVVSQLGFVAAYTIFIAQNMQAFVLAVTDCKTLIPVYVLIFGQLIAYLPLAMIRNIQKLSGTALVADVFILTGLLYVFGYELNIISKMGVAPIVMFNPQSFPLMVGTAVFAFEGVGLVIPITESMKEPHKFPAVLSGVMAGLLVLFAGAGALGYAAFGSDVETVVLVNLSQEDKFVNAAQFLYSMAIMLSTPLQLFPAVRIMENGLFSRSGKYSNQVKWQKNMFRTLTVVFCAFVAWAGAGDLDKFVSLMGSLACVPLCFCYPPLLHYRAIAKTLRQKTIDIIIFLFGVIAAIYTTYQTMGMILHDKSDDNPNLGKCPLPSF
ncbi:hypothetical protein O181_063235 [Austropuccinia psidii MF-1]|uniref:Amino acid transporter transmembrane domain-containing protein n=1 Tax=Austropuccinia psidii MF-1 TaxID=1389203 RepID=A0A9Q3EQW1_9BASI|nr:hypothetical protein [Austropuccinia psidii MF-1]